MSGTPGATETFSLPEYNSPLLRTNVEDFWQNAWTWPVESRKPEPGFPKETGLMYGLTWTMKSRPGGGTLAHTSLA